MWMSWVNIYIFTIILNRSTLSYLRQTYLNITGTTTTTTASKRGPGNKDNKGVSENSCELQNWSLTTRYDNFMPRTQPFKLGASAIFKGQSWHILDPAHKAVIVEVFMHIYIYIYVCVCVCVCVHACVCVCVSLHPPPSVAGGSTSLGVSLDATFDLPTCLSALVVFSIQTGDRALIRVASQ